MASSKPSFDRQGPSSTALPVLVATTLIFTALFIVSTFVVDILYGFLDPRIRFS